ncbi:hypothetical protein [Humidisolicoccus flavus]|uniref:hypothetical protein n=1 Tax=Humidisolicoccus flavus TaxID=3111414 RepID=UPI0032456C40
MAFSKQTRSLWTAVGVIALASLSGCASAPQTPGDSSGLSSTAPSEASSTTSPSPSTENPSTPEPSATPSAPLPETTAPTEPAASAAKFEDMKLQMLFIDVVPQHPSQNFPQGELVFETVDPPAHTSAVLDIPATGQCGRLLDEAAGLLGESVRMSELSSDQQFSRGAGVMSRTESPAAAARFLELIDQVQGTCSAEHPYSEQPAGATYTMFYGPERSISQFDFGSTYGVFWVEAGSHMQTMTYVACEELVLHLPVGSDIDMWQFPGNWAQAQLASLGCPLPETNYFREAE